MSESELFDLGMKSIANDLPEQWKVYSEYTNGIKEHFLLGNIDQFERIKKIMEKSK